MSRITKYTADKDYSRNIEWLKGVYFESEFFVIKDGKSTVKKDFTWDGASPKFRINGKIYGTPDIKDKTWYATMWHDSFYKNSEYLNIPRYLVDALFLYDLQVSGYKFKAVVYWLFVRLVGVFTWKSTKIIEDVSFN